MRKITHLHSDSGFASFELSEDGSNVLLTTTDGGEECITIVIPMRDFMRSAMDVNLFLWDYEIRSLTKKEVVNG